MKYPRTILSIVTTGALVGCATVDWTLGSAESTTGIRFEYTAPETTLFPSNLFTVTDRSNHTGLRINLPKPDCNVHPSDCEDVNILNQLDGFNAHPRITVPFSADIDPASVSSKNIYLIRLDGTGPSERIGVNQIMWDPATRVLAMRADAVLAQHARYAIVVTDAIRDPDGKPISRRPFGAFLNSLQANGKGNPELDAYRKALLNAARAAHLDLDHVAGMSVISTQSATTDLEAIRDQIKASNPRPADFLIANVKGMPAKAVLDIADIRSVTHVRQTGVAPLSFSRQPVDVRQMRLVTNGSATVAYGKFDSPQYRTAEGIFPPAGTLSGKREPMGRESVYFTLYLPSGKMPSGGWPVAIIGHGYNDSKDAAVTGFASVLPSHGIAVIGINAVGHGGGADSRLEIETSRGLVSLLSGGRSVDMDHDGKLAGYEGMHARGLPLASLVDNRDGLRQTVVDLMQLVRTIEVGMDVNGDGIPDLNRERIYFAGASMGGVYGTAFLGTEPRIRAGMLIVTGGPWIDLVRLGAIRARPDAGYGLALSRRKPALTNVRDGNGIRYNENVPARDQPVAINDVTGAMKLQELFDRHEWVSQSASPLAYAPYIARTPLPGNTPKPTIMHLAYGDAVVTTTPSLALIRAGGLEARTTLFRYDRLRAEHPELPKDPHRWQTGVVAGTEAQQIDLQHQMAIFFSSDGSRFVDPDGDGLLFENKLPH